MRKESTSRVSSTGVFAVMPKSAIAPRKPLRRRLDERAEEKPAPEQAAPPPGMGIVVDKSA
ncbi:MAG TPA: hypothetical protein VFC45_03410 [Pseudolabrys sp.]|nr:hypothetical protein [Pseudolabrys sp.]